MLKRWGKAAGIGLLLIALLGTVYLRMNQADFDRRTLQPYDYQMLTTEAMFFEKGTYTFTFSYTYAPDVRVQILRGQTADANNALPLVLADEALNAAGQTVITLTLDTAVYDLQLRYTGDVARGFTLIESVSPVWSDTWLALWMISGGAVLLLWLYRRKAAPTDAGVTQGTVYLLLFAVSVWATLPVLRGFLVQGHDLAMHLLRIENLKDGLLDGQFPVRIGPSFGGGAGYASSVLYPELFLYLPALFRLCGASILASYQAFVFLINLATLLVTYRAMKRLTGSAGTGFLVSVVYSLNIYRLISLYYRAAVGETLAMIFFPCVLLGMVEALRYGKLSRWLILGMTGLLQSHILSVQIAAVLGALYAAYCILARKTTLRGLLMLAAAAGVSVLISLWFLVPFARFAQEDFSVYSYRYTPAKHALYPAQLFASFLVPYGRSEALGTTAEMPLSVGALLGLSLPLFALAFGKTARRPAAIGAACLGFALLLMTMASTLFPWSYAARVPLLQRLLLVPDYPWRYLGLAGLLLSIVFAISAWSLGHNRGRLLIAVCLVAALFNAAPFLDQYSQYDGQTFSMRGRTDWSVLKRYVLTDYRYRDAAPLDGAAQTTRILSPDGVTITGFSKRGTHVTFTYASDSAQTVTLPLYLYPGYRAVLDGGTELAATAGDNHKLSLALPAGGGTVTVWYAGFWYWNAANFVSLLALAAWAARAAVKRGFRPRREVLRRQLDKPRSPAV